MSYVAFESDTGGTGQEFPLFLSREREGGTGVIQPPPLPPMPRFYRVRRVLAAWPRALVFSAAAASLLTCASAALLARSNWGALEVPLPQPAKSVRSEVTDALEAAAQIESRLSYASALRDQLERSAAASAAADAAGNQTLDAVEPTLGETNSVALLVLRNLPDDASLKEGAAAGPGSWALAAGDPDQLNSNLGEGFEKPVTADVELISRSGVLLGALRLRLKKEDEKQIAEVQSDPADGAASQSAADDDKPVKRKRRAHGGSGKKFAYAHRRHFKRMKSGDAGEEESASAEGNSNAGAKEGGGEPGLMSKFFSWLKGSTTTEPPPQTGNDTMRSGLGMAPRD